jgi:hypothetical protein
MAVATGVRGAVGALVSAGGGAPTPAAGVVTETGPAAVLEAPVRSTEVTEYEYVVEGRAVQSVKPVEDAATVVSAAPSLVTA